MHSNYCILQGEKKYLEQLLIPSNHLVREPYSINTQICNFIPKSSLVFTRHFQTKQNVPESQIKHRLKFQERLPLT